MADFLQDESLGLSSDVAIHETDDSSSNKHASGHPASIAQNIVEDTHMSSMKAGDSNGISKGDCDSVSDMEEEPKGRKANGKSGLAAGNFKASKAPRTPKGKKKAAEDKPKKTPAKKRVPSSIVQGDHESDHDYDVEAEKPKGHKKRVSINVPHFELGDPSTPQTKKRRTPINTPTSGRAIPESRDDLDENDKMLLDMKEAGKGWPEIRKAFEEKGIKTGASTLPNRYSRLTAKLTTWKTGDEDIFLEVKSVVEADIMKETNALISKLEIEKWSRISEAIVSKGGDKYTSAALQKKAKDLHAKSTPKASQGLNGDPSVSGTPSHAKAAKPTLPTKTETEHGITEDDDEDE